MDCVYQNDYDLVQNLYLAYLDHEEVSEKLSRELDDAVTELKESEEGELEYMTWMTYGAEREADGKYIRNVEMIRGWYDEKKALSIPEAAGFMNITISQFEDVLALIKEHPELDDADIADRVDWRRYK